MTLIKSISGIRGTIGGKQGDNLTPPDVVRFVSAYAEMIRGGKDRPLVVTGRDARVSGPVIRQLVNATLVSLGVDVLDIGLSTTPTVELAVPAEKADGGIIITASHNPAEWNALKLLNAKGEFISSEEGTRLLELAEAGDFQYQTIDRLGMVRVQDNWIDKHIKMVCEYPLTDNVAIRQCGFKVAVDAVNSTGGIAIPKLLKALGVNDVVELYCEPNGQFPHNPEPLPEHLTAISKAVVDHKCDLGIVVDPDVDRLCFINEDGTVFGEEYTLVAVADYVLKRKGGGNTVSNLSSTRALRDVTRLNNGEYQASAVGEVNVVQAMKSSNAVIGGEGNGGVIVPDLHYGRDALIGTALFLSHLAHSGLSMTGLKATYPSYFMVKQKIELTPDIDVDGVLDHLAKVFSSEELNRQDGLKIDFEQGWVHMRKSNTEPIIRIYAEGQGAGAAEELAMKVRRQVDQYLIS